MHNHDEPGQRQARLVGTSSATHESLFVIGLRRAISGGPGASWRRRTQDLQTIHKDPSAATVLGGHPFGMACKAI
jgi:hypothetical protein